MTNSGPRLLATRAGARLVAREVLRFVRREDAFTLFQWLAGGFPMWPGPHAFLFPSGEASFHALAVASELVSRAAEKRVDFVAAVNLAALVAWSAPLTCAHIAKGCRADPLLIPRLQDSLRTVETQLMLAVLGL